MTFSIAARSGDAWGVAVASKFVCVGSVVPEVRLGYGAVATQSFVRFPYRSEILDALAEGTSAQAALDATVAADDGRESRQLGVVGADGAATYTGGDCMDWAGGVARGDGDEAYAIQGNILVGQQVGEEMERAFLATAGQSLDRRLLAALVAGDAAGGDARGRQSAALLVRSPGAGYEACGILADVSVDDHPDAVTELTRVHEIATLVLGRPEDVRPLEGGLYEEVSGHLRRLGYEGSDVEASLAEWAGVVNLENRLVPGSIDSRVLDELRRP
ncbi:MAG: DUF1028 domain-containing protein [Actinobacteria bacterium]|nr:DUF1028 domain-containing protein [Actinomycetota bacterium]